MVWKEEGIEGIQEVELREFGYTNCGKVRQKVKARVLLVLFSLGSLRT